MPRTAAGAPVIIAADSTRAAIFIAMLPLAILVLPMACSSPNSPSPSWVHRIKDGIAAGRTAKLCRDFWPNSNPVGHGALLQASAPGPSGIKPGGQIGSTPPSQPIGTEPASAAA